MLPYLVDPFLIIVFRNAIVRLPQEIMESAEVDGASEFTILFRIVFALIIPMVAAFTIISAVFYWNMWFPVLIFIRDKWKWTLQYMLRDIYTNPLIGGGQLDVGNIVEDLDNILPSEPDQRGDRLHRDAGRHHLPVSPTVFHPRGDRRRRQGLDR